LILLDANILLYAFDARAAKHEATREWLEEALSGEETIGIPWLSAWAFIRISTNPRLSERALSPAQALGVLGKLRANSLVVMVGPGPRHADLLLQQMLRGQVQGADTTDAALAALAIEEGALLASCDAGFRRFPDLQWVYPLAEPGKANR
jgi:uncharacterized protein